MSMAEARFVMTVHPLLKEAASKLLHERADKDGMIVGLTSDDIALAVHTHNSKIRGLIHELMAEQRLICLQESRGNRAAVYRLIDPPQETLFAETVIRMVRSAPGCSTDDPRLMPVSLPRLKCLERPL
jgi:hypothetical protein